MYGSNYAMRGAIAKRQPMTVDMLRQRAPSAFAEAPSARVSDKYEFIPTTKVIGLLEREGWVPVLANQSKSRIEGGADTVRHMITFQNASVARIGQDIPELILTNAHNGLAAFNIMAGLYRQVCSNGLMVFSPTFGSYSVKHIGFKADEVIEASYKIIESVPQLTASVNAMRDVTLNHDEQLALASSALLLKYEDGKSPLTAEQLLTTRRHEDRDGTLWTTFNGIQENIIKGGLRGVTVNERGQQRRARTRAVGSVTENVRLNKALWALAEQMRALKVG